MAFDPNQPGIPTPNQSNEPAMPNIPGANSQGSTPTEQQVRTMRADMGATPPAAAPQNAGLPSFDSEEPAFTPETTNNAGTISSVDHMIAEGKPGHMGWIIGGIGAFIVLAAVGYFVVYPMLSKPSAAPVTNPTAGGPVTPIAPTPTTTAPTAPVTPAVAHTSQFINPPAGTVTEKFAGAFSANLLSALLVKDGQDAQSGVTEIVLQDPNGNPVNLQTVLAALAPTLQPSDVPAATGDNLTAFMYKDTTGVWPGYIGQFDPAAPAASVTAFEKKLEAGSIKNFFVVDPGTVTAFKSGTVNGITDRYATGKTAGASFGYLVTKNKLLISTSFAGMKEALRLMGL